MSVWRKNTGSNSGKRKAKRSGAVEALAENQKSRNTARQLALLMGRSKKGPGVPLPSPNSHDAERLGNFREPQPSCIQSLKRSWGLIYLNTTSGLMDGQTVPLKRDTKV